MFRGIDVKAVVLGIAADLAATFVATMAVMTFLGIGAGVKDLPEEEARQLIESTFQEPKYLLLGGLLGLLGTVVGGYVAAKFAAEHINKYQAQELQYLFSKLETCWDHYEEEEIGRLDIALHIKIADICGNKSLKSMIAS